MVLYSWRVLNAATNVNGMGRNSCYGLADILFGQAARENEEACEGTGRSCG
jgi:hypothetical protein